MAKYRVPTKAVKDLGFRSKLEVIVNQQLYNSGIRFAYEGRYNTIRYERPATQHRYLGDFLLQNGIMIEAKGYFSAVDRRKHILIKEQYPHLDVRFLFSNEKNKLSKKSNTTYADWCDKNGFLHANKVIPKEWLEEVKTKDTLSEILATLKGMQKK